MGLLDDVFSGFGGGGGGAPKFLRGNVRAGEKLLAEGEPATAEIAGIRVRRGNEDSPDQYEFSLRFTGSSATTVRAGCRMSLGALLRDIRLGMEVPIRHDGRERAIIDVPAMAGVEAEDAAWGYKPLDPPEDGIADDNFSFEKERRKSAAVVAAVVTVTPFEVMGMRTQNFDVRVRVTPADGGAPYETVAKREAVPFYGLHLAEPGVELPALVRPGRPDKVRIDWPAAAVADPGVGRPPAAAVAAPAPAPEAALTSSAASADWSPAGLAADDDGGEVEGVDFATWVAVEAGLVRDRVKPADYDAYAAGHGVPAGEWQAVQSGWQQRMMRDPRLGARFGAEYQAALKRR